MAGRRHVLLWAVVAFALSSLSIPWFLWGDDAVAAGLPVWLWWHVGWMGLTSFVFYVFTRRAWGIGVDGGVHDG